MRAVIFRDRGAYTNVLSMVVIAIAFGQLPVEEAMLGLDNSIAGLPLTSLAAGFLIATLPATFVQSDHSEGVIIMLHCASVGVGQYFLGKMVTPLAVTLCGTMLNMVWLAYVLGGQQNGYTKLIKQIPQTLLSVTACIICAVAFSILISFISSKQNQLIMYTGLWFDILVMFPLLVAWLMNLISTAVCMASLMALVACCVAVSEYCVSRRYAKVLH